MGLNRVEKTRTLVNVSEQGRQDRIKCYLSKKLGPKKSDYFERIFQKLRGRNIRIYEIEYTYRSDPLVKLIKKVTPKRELLIMVMENKNGKVVETPLEDIV